MVKRLKPKLRFKEFRSEWRNIKLDSLMQFKNGINATKEQYGKGKKFINVLDILSDKPITYESIQGLVEVSENIFNKNTVTFGDIVFQRSSETREEVGTANVYLDRDKIATFGGFVIRGKKIGEYDPIFMNKLLKTPSARNEITSKSGGSTRYNLSQSTLNEVVLKFPSLSEQEKIASFLSSVDSTIEKLEKKRELLREYKKGVMQKIFSQEIRFKDENGEEYPQWEKKKLKDTISLIIDNRGKTPPVSEEGIPLIEVNAMGEKNIKYEKIKKFVSLDTYHSWFRKHLEDGDLLFSTVGATATLSLYKSSTLAAVAQNIVGLRFKKENSNFMYYLLSEVHNNRKFKKIEMGAVQPSVKVSQAILLKFKFPCLEEQEKIANFLSSVDKKIELVEKEVESNKGFKKGLLQQMFV